MKRPLYYLLCAIACASMVGATMPMAAIAEAIQPQETAEQQAQSDATSSYTDKAEDGTNTNATADTVKDSTATSTNASAAKTYSADGTTAAATDTATTPTPSLRAQTTPTPEAIPTTSQTTYAHSATATQNGVTFTVSWNDAPAGAATTFHITQTNGSSQAKARMDVPTYWDGGSQESVCDPSRPAWASYCSLGTTGHDFTFDFTASGAYRIYFYFMDNDRNDPQNDKGIYYLRTTAEVTVNDAARPSVTQIVNDAVDLCRQEANGSEYDMALWLHDWTLDQLEYDHSLNWCSAESGLTRHQGTCESYQRIYSKLLDAAGIANGRITGNGHTWNAVKIDGKWCQMDLTWDDTSDNWYGDLDQRHLYFGLTDELMAIAHSDHTANYQKADYAYRSTDLSNNYFVRNGKVDEWAKKYADRIQRHLDAKEESFSIDADNQSFPPSISGIQNGIVAYAMNQREWKTDGAKVNLTATSNVTKESNSKWNAKYDLKAEYKTAALGSVIDDGPYRLATALDDRMAVSASASGCSLSSDAGALYLERDGATGLYRISSGGLLLTESGNRAVLAEADGSASQLWRVSDLGGGRHSFTSASGLALDDRGQRTSEGNTVWLYEPNGGPAQAWLLADPAIPRTVDDGPYRLATALDDRMAVSASASGCSLSSDAGALYLERDGATGLYRISSGGLLLTESGNRAVLAEADGSASQLWRVSDLGGGRHSFTSASGLALDDRGQRTSEGNTVWLYEPNGGPAQAWLLADPAIPRTVDDGPYRLATALDDRMAVSASASGCSLSSDAGALYLERDGATGLYRISSGGLLLTESGNRAVLAEADGSASQLWRVSDLGGGRHSFTSASGLALDDRGQRTSEGNTVWLYEPNGGPAQAWVLT
ncbi:MAG: transglutaminase domain-containing protein [Collinsella sp.]